MVEFLLAHGACIQACDEGGLHPLHNACSFGHADVVRLLLEAGASPNTTDNWNYTPLHEAASKGKVDVCIGNLTFTWVSLLTNFTNISFLIPCSPATTRSQCKYSKLRTKDSTRSGR